MSRIIDLVTEEDEKWFEDFANNIAKVNPEISLVKKTFSACENGHTLCEDIELCPICQGKIVDKKTKTIGFKTPYELYKNQFVEL